ncbi:protein of unknown function [Beijerinckiaceae bacterium RH AL1]|nr:protein of unknown function [Beijerinckiaceae bacterium RH AL1]
MDWRPIHPHTNTCGPKDLRGLTSYTGIHDFRATPSLDFSGCRQKTFPSVYQLTMILTTSMRL